MLNLDSGEGHVLSGVDAHCGYLASKTLDLRDLRELFPELSGELTKPPAVEVAHWKPPARATGAYDADDCPF